MISKGVRGNDSRQGVESALNLHLTSITLGIFPSHIFRVDNLT
jgi:hypothetical protein